jgi:hypothetical protein
MFVGKQHSGIIMKGNCLLARSPMKRTCLLGNNRPKLELFIDKQLIRIFFSKPQYFHIQRQIGMLSTSWSSHVVSKFSLYLEIKKN